MTGYVPFPVDALPDLLARFVRETAAALGCDPAYVALPVLATTAAAIGTTRAIELKATWREPAVVWAVIVARSGTLKSPAMDAAVEPLRRAQYELLRKHEAAQAAHDEAMQRYERDMDVWKRSKTGDAPPKKPVVPTVPRIVVADTTIEALAPILADNPRGVLLARDELRAWADSFGQYKGGRGGDAAAWLEFWRAGTIIVDRKTGERRTIFIRRAAVSVSGTIQPGILARVVAGEHTESGFAARLLMAQPPELAKRWSRRVPSRAAVAGYESALVWLLALRHADKGDGPEPIALKLTEDADGLWGNWFGRLDERRRRVGTDAEAAALAKIEAYAARFALIFALVADPNAQEVGRDALERALKLADWFAGEALRLYGMLAAADDPEAAELRRLSEWAARQNGAVTPRDVARHLRGYTAETAEAALAGLVAAGLGCWEPGVPGPAGGRPTRRFRLTRRADADETPETARNSEVSSASAVDAELAALPASDDDGDAEWTA